MKVWSLMILFFMPIAGFTQNVKIIDPFDRTLSASEFSLSLSMFNHAEWIYKGATTYSLTENEIKIINTPFGQKKGKIIFSKTISSSKNILANLIIMRLDTLKDHYTNWCIMTTSGTEYFLNFSSEKQNVEVSLHHFYLKQLEKIVEILNSLLPQKFQFTYLPKDTHQDCKP